jgi:hypothetical protein
MLSWEVLVVNGVVPALPAKEHVSLYMFSIVALPRRTDATVQLLLPFSSCSRATLTAFVTIQLLNRLYSFGTISMSDRLD